MRINPFYLIPAIALTCLSASAETYNLNFGWRFSPGDIPGAEATAFDDSRWSAVSLPHDFQIHQPWVEPAPDERPDKSNQMANITSRLSSRGFKEMGQGWYRTTLSPAPEWKGRRVLLDFEGIMLTGDVYLNGQRIGGTDYGYLGFEIDITDKLNYDRPNIIAVRADTGKPENSRWYTGGGLYRDVSIRVTDPKQYFTRHPLSIATPVVDSRRSIVTVDAEIATRIKADSITVGIDITDSDGKTVYSKKRKHWNYRRQRIREFRLDSIALDNVRLWDCENPNLYTLVATLYHPDGSVADKVSERFGIRKVEFSPEFGMKLNGKKVLLKGIANHHTLGALGAATYPRAMEKRIKMLKDFGFNHIRTSHNPYSKSFLDLCDEYGILVVDELYDKWTKQYSGGRTPWSQRWQEDIPEWVRRDRNHPSVVFWSLGNELQMISTLDFNDWGVTTYKLQKTLLKRYDGSDRPVTVAMHPRGRNEKTDSLPAPLVMETDIAAYNYRYMYFPGDSRRFPWMMFYQSEANTSNLGPNYFEMDLDKVIGLAYWGMIDYLGESQGWPAKGWTQGVFDIALDPKPMAYFLRSFFKPDEPMVHIAPFEETGTTEWNGVAMGGKKFTDGWNFSKGDTVKLYTYTNADEVELILNGRSLGRKQNNISDPKQRNRIVWEGIRYSPGKIEAVAYNRGGGNKPVARHQLSTTGKAVRLIAESDNQRWLADGLDLQHIRIEAVDSKGRCDKSASYLLTFSVKGPAEIVGVINGDMTSGEMTVGKTRRLFNGTATVILRSARLPGEVTLTISADGKKAVRKTMKTFPAASPEYVRAPMPDVNQVTDNTPDSINKARTARPIAGSTRKGDNPVLFLVGNSTMRTGTLGNGSNGQWGWGYYMPEYFDDSKITVENHALGGMSSRTFYRQLWPDVVKGIRPGDWVIIELGHNDNGPYDSGRARATIPGTGTESLPVTIKETGVRDTVYTYGEYMRRYVREVKARGAHPILFSLTPRNAWTDDDSTRVARVSDTFGLWARQVAEAEGVPFIDLNEITARKFERFGKEKVKTMFYLDRIHTSEFGARVNAESAVEGLMALNDITLKDYILPVPADSVTGSSRRPGCPVVFTIGDSTVKNEDKDDDSMWGWGSVLAECFDTTKVSVENHAIAGRSARTFLDEGRWDKIYKALQPGDFVIIQFGHNDGGEINTGKARGELRGAGDESKVFKMEKTRRNKVVYTYGWYLRKFIMDAREKGAIPIVVSHTPRNRWKDGVIESNADSFGLWARQAAERGGACFIDLNAISGRKLQQLDEGRTSDFFKRDHTHTSLKGARLNARSIADGLRASDCQLREYLLPAD